MLTIKTRKDCYFDSVMLMGISTRLREMPGIEDASVAMGTPANLVWMAEGGLMAAHQAPDVAPSDLVIVIKGDEDAVERAVADLDGLLAGTPGEADAVGARQPVYRSLAQAVQHVPEANVAMISIPGAYARVEAERALRAGLHVHLFSDNVSVEDEIALKQLASSFGLLMMGPDCGTAIISGKGLGFANRVSRGPVGIVGASGTGIQQFSCLLDALGVGVSHALGTGGHDLSDRVGGITFKAALRALGDDPSTKVLALISKPPSRAVAEEVIREAAASGKPVVVCFLGAELSSEFGDSVVSSRTLEGAARLAARMVSGNDPAWPMAWDAESAHSVENALCAGARSGQLRGFFCGGTMCTEAQMVLAGHIGRVYSNASFRGDLAWSPDELADGHLLVDMGDDFFTVGRPHPMMDGTARLRQLETSLADDSTAVVLLDVILGSGAEADPAGPIAALLRQARAEGRTVPVVVSFCAAQADPQGFHAQAQVLRDAGAYVFRSNAAAARAAAALLLGDRAILSDGV